MDYEPDPAAARLAAGRTKTVLVLVPHLASWYFSTVIAGAEAVCNESGYEFLVIGVGTLDESSRLLGDSARIERRADGIVLVNIPATDAQAASLNDRGVALSTIGTNVPGAPSVFIDDVEVGRIGAADTDRTRSPPHRPDQRARRGPLELRGPEAPHRRVRRGDPRIGDPARPGARRGRRASGSTGARRRCRPCSTSPTRRPPCSPCPTRWRSARSMELKRRDLRPGVDISVIGVDDHDIARVLALSTIRQDVASQGAAAARGLIAVMSSQPIESRTRAVSHRARPAGHHGASRRRRPLIRRGFRTETGRWSLTSTRRVCKRLHCRNHSATSTRGGGPT